MAARGIRVTVATSATKLNGASSDSVAGQSFLVRNRGAASVFLGGSTVTTAAGYELLADESLALDVNEDVYGICASGTVECHVLETGV